VVTPKIFGNSSGSSRSTQQQLLRLDDGQFRIKNDNVATQQGRHYMGILQLVKLTGRQNHGDWCAAQAAAQAPPQMAMRRRK
jgi:hypothetical protein